MLKPGDQETEKASLSEKQAIRRFIENSGLFLVGYLTLASGSLATAASNNEDLTKLLFDTRELQQFLEFSFNQLQNRGLDENQICTLCAGTCIVSANILILWLGNLHTAK